MDIVTLALAQPKVIDLTKFTTTDGHTFNDLLFLMMAASLEGDGALQTMTVNDTNHELRNAMKTDRQIVLSMDAWNAITKAPASITIVNGAIGQCSVSSASYMDGLIFTIVFTIVFSSGTSDRVDLFLKATHVTS